MGENRHLGFYDCHYPKLTLFLLIVTVIPASVNSSANILFLFGGGSLSHKISAWPLATGLADKGYNVTFLSSNVEQPVYHPSVLDITPKLWKKEKSELYNLDRIIDRIEGKQWGSTLDSYEPQTLEFCRFQLDTIFKDSDLHSVLFNRHYDLVIINSIFGECSLLLAHHLKLKYIVYVSAMILPWFYGTYGLPIEAASIPHVATLTERHPMSLLDRMTNVIKYFVNYKRSSQFNKNMEDLYKSKFGLSSSPTFPEIEYNASLLLVNSHHSIDFARSSPPMFVDVGGMQCWGPQKPLPQDLQAFLDGAEEGLILITLGSTTELSKVSQKHIDMFWSIMRNHPNLRFIWRWEGAVPTNQPTNLLSTSWLPQKEILGHPKTVGFISHAGMNSVLEATFHGVPIISLPLFVDQDVNAYRIEAHEIGIRLEAQDLSESVLTSAVSEILNNPKYRENIRIRSKMFRDRPRGPIDEAVYWTEFVLRNNDTSSLKPMLLNQGFWIRNSVDVLLVFAALSMLSPILLIASIWKFVKWFY